MTTDIYQTRVVALGGGWSATLRPPTAAEVRTAEKAAVAESRREIAAMPREARKAIMGQPPPAGAAEVDPRRPPGPDAMDWRALAVACLDELVSEEATYSRPVGLATVDALPYPAWLALERALREWIYPSSEADDDEGFRAQPDPVVAD